VERAGILKNHTRRLKFLDISQLSILDHLRRGKDIFNPSRTVLSDQIIWYKNERIDDGLKVLNLEIHRWYE